MERKVYIICQKKSFLKGKNKPKRLLKLGTIPQVLSDGGGKLLYVYASDEGKKRAEKLVKRLNSNFKKQAVHLREGVLKIGKEA